MKSKIRIEDLSLSFFHNSYELKVIDKISFEVFENETIAVLGPSGCGKSTLLKLIGGLNLDAIQSGNISIDQESPICYRKKGKTGFAFQNPVLLKWRNVFDNVMLPLELKNIDSENSNKKVYEVLRLTGLKEFAFVYPNELSGGMKQRVNLARTIVHDPDLLLLDEPFGSLDEISRLKLNFILRRLLRMRKYTAIMVTHSLREALLISDRIILLTNRPSNVFYQFKPKLKNEVYPGIETSIEFNIELERLTHYFLKLEDDAYKI